MSYRDTASFGKRIEHYLIGKMLKEGLDCYIPLVDDDGIDVVIRKPTGEYIEVQIKARSNSVKVGDAALFSALTHKLRDNYYFVFYSERLDKMFIMNSREFLVECVTNKTGKNKGKRSIWFNGYKMNKTTGIKKEYIYPRFEKYIAKDFSRFTMSDVEKLCAFIPYFENVDLDKVCQWGGGEKDEEGVIQMPYPKYDDEFNQFIETFDETKLQCFDYTNQLEQRVPDWQSINICEVIRTADFNLVRTILTKAIRAERFCDGAWANSIESGLFLEILRRLKELSQTTGDI